VVVVLVEIIVVLDLLASHELMQLAVVVAAVQVMTYLVVPVVPVS